MQHVAEVSVTLFHDIFHLSEWTKTLGQFAGVILALYPVKILYGAVVYKVICELQEEKVDCQR